MSNMQLKLALQHGVKLLTTNSKSARLDAELLLIEVLQKSKTFLYAYPEYELTTAEQQAFQALLEQRKQGKPMAYILKRQAFWDMELEVQEGVLIPRPETECLVEKILTLLPNNQAQLIADLGTGSGAIALALAKACSKWSLTATDISETALQIAAKNAQKYNIKNIEFIKSSWCEALDAIRYNCMVANPPYIAEHDPELETYVAKYEPKSALIAGQNGLADIEIIAKTAYSHLATEAYLVLEHGYNQANAVQSILERHNYRNIRSYKDYSQHLRFTIGQKA